MTDRRALTPGLLLALLLAAATHSRAAALTELVAAWSEPALAGEGRDVKSLEVTTGNLSLTLRAGRAAPVQVQGKAVGFFFVGQGELAYHLAEPIEVPVVRHNLKVGSDLDLAPGGNPPVIRDTFDTLLWLGAGLPLPDLGATPAPAPAGEYREFRERQVTIHFTTPRYQFAHQALGAPDKRLVRVETTGGKEDLLYLLDQVSRHGEALFQVRRSEFNDPEWRRYLWPTLLSEQPLGRTRKEVQAPEATLVDLDLTLEASAGKGARVEAAETYLGWTKPRAVLDLALLSREYEWKGPAGLETRELHVRKVTGADGTPLAFLHEMDELLVELAAPLPPAKKTTVKFEIDGDILIRPGGDSYWMLRSEAWYPQPRLVAQHHTTHLTVKAAKPFLPFASGTEVRRASEGEHNLVETRIDNPISFPAVIAGKYETYEETREGRTVKVATYSQRNERAMKKLAGLAFSIIDYYEPLLGPFPFPALTIVQANDVGWGQAPATMMLITSEAFGLLDNVDKIFSEGINARFAHEIAHQYWGHVVKWPSDEEQWLSEAFAEYTAALFLRGKSKGDYKDQRRSWEAGFKDARDAAPIPLANRIVDGPEMAWRKRQGLLYDKGALLLAHLHHELGDEAFFTFLRSFQESFRWKFGQTRHVEGLLARIGKKDYHDFFEHCFWGMEMPGK